METEQINTSERDKNEEEILTRSKSEPEAFKSIYTKYFKKIFLFVLHRIGEKQISADITQQVFLRALMGLSKFQFKGLPFSAYLLRIFQLVEIQRWLFDLQSDKIFRCIDIEMNFWIDLL